MATEKTEKEFRFKCPCTNPFCDLEEKLQKNADALGIALQTSASFLGILKATAGAAPVPGLKELAGGLLQFVVAIQDKNEVTGGFNHIVVDCCRVTCVVCEHAKRRNYDLSPVIKRAILQLTHDLSLIKKYALKRNKRNVAMRMLMASADKAEVNEWRQRLTTSWGVFTTELLMDTNYQVNKIRSDEGLDVAKLLEKFFEQVFEKKGDAAIEYFSEHAQPSSASKARRSKRRNAEPQQDDQPQGDYQYHQNEPQSNEYYSGGNVDDPQTYDGSQQGEYQQGYQSQYQQDHQPQQQQYPKSNANPFRSQTAYPARPSQQQYFSDPEYYANGHPSGYSTPYDDYYGYGYQQPHPPPPHRYYTLPAPPPPSSHGSAVNSIGSVTNANFGVNHGTITQHAY